MQNLRKPAALVVALAALVPLALIRFSAPGGGLGGGGVRGGFDYEYTTGELTAAETGASILLAVLLAAAAAAIWTARDRRLRLLAPLAVAVAAAGTAAAVANLGDGTLSTAEARAAAPGTGRDALEDRLGRPAGAGTATRGSSAPLPCTVYLTPAGAAEHIYCFDGDRLAFTVRG